MNGIQLYRPVGIKELELIIHSGFRKFPPRLSWQPIFYPVLHQSYAEHIAAEWNTADAFSGYCGIVTAFEIATEHYNRYTIQNVGDSTHNELWVPAEELETFNEHILDGIRIICVFFGPSFVLPDNEIIRQELLKFKHDTL
jgi:hypothetical protein